MNGVRCNFTSSCGLCSQNTQLPASSFRAQHYKMYGKMMFVFFLLNSVFFIMFAVLISSTYSVNKYVNSNFKTEMVKWIILNQSYYA